LGIARFVFGQRQRAVLDLVDRVTGLPNIGRSGAQSVTNATIFLSVVNNMVYKMSVPPICFVGFRSSDFIRVYLCPSVVKIPSDFMDSAFPPAGNLLADFYLFIRVFVRLVGVVHGLLVEHKKSPNLVLSSRGQNNRTLRETRPGD
jgi:hypothetical protein